tara:strand:- start:17606 stop:18640 length:1035 start_codon:yes stop_codon:yes gene_type:complete
MACFFSLGPGCKMSEEEVKIHVKKTVKEDEELKLDIKSNVKKTVKEDEELQKHMEDISSEPYKLKKKMLEKPNSFKEFIDMHSQTKDIMKKREKEKAKAILSDDEYRVKQNSFKEALPYCEVVDNGVYACKPPPENLKLPYKAVSFMEQAFMGTTKYGYVEDDSSKTPLEISALNTMDKFEKLPASDFCIMLDSSDNEYVCFEDKEDLKSKMIKERIDDKIKQTATLTNVNTGTAIWKKDAICTRDISLNSYKCQYGYDDQTDVQFCQMYDDFEDVFVRRFSKTDREQIMSLCQSKGLSPEKESSCVPDNEFIGFFKESEKCCSQYAKDGVCQPPPKKLEEDQS